MIELDKEMLRSLQLIELDLLLELDRVAKKAGIPYRIIAGTMVEIGLHRLPVDAFSRALISGSRLDLGMTAPAHGLELTEVRYPEMAFSNPASLRWHQP